MVPVPPFISVAVMAELVAPMVVCGNVRWVGVVVTLPEVEAPPVPASGMVCGLLPAASLKLRVAVRVPAAFGAK